MLMFDLATGTYINSSGGETTAPMSLPVTDLHPSHIAFASDGHEVGRLVLSDPIHFEGNATESAQAFFDALKDLIMVAVAKKK